MIKHLLKSRCFIFLYKGEDMRYFTFNLNGEEINMRLNSSACEQIEKTYNCTLLDYVQQGSVTSIITLLQHM